MNDLPSELHQFRKLIDKAKRSKNLSELRDIIRTAADEISDADILHIAEFMFQRCAERHRAANN